MASKRDYYDVLGVGKSASKDEIKKAYRKTAVKFHPDRNPGDSAAEDKFKEATEAYEVLMDDQKRARYDQYGHHGLDGMGAGPGGFGFSSDFSIFEGMEDIFGDLGGIGDLFGGFFGGRSHGGRGRSRVRRGQDLRIQLTVDLEDVLNGRETKVEIKRHERCDRCHGNGAEPGSSPQNCPTCQGHGVVIQSQGFFSIKSTCPTCHGRGQKITNLCKRCGGDGLLTKARTLNLKIPSGIENGVQLRISGEGDHEPGGGPSGHLYVSIIVKPHQYFRRDGANLICSLPISYTQAVLGTQIFVPTLKEKVKLRIPPGTQPGKIFRLRGQGLPYMQGRGRGDLNVIINIDVPQSVNKNEKRLLEEYAALHGDTDTPTPLPGRR